MPWSRRSRAPRPHAAWVFLGPAHAPGAEVVRDRLRSALPGASLIGCTAGGVIGGGREFEQPDAFAVVAAHLPGVTLTTFHLEQSGLPDADAGPSAWQTLLRVPAGSQPSFVVLADPYTIPADALAAGLDFAWPGSVTVGGLASGAQAQGEQVLFCDDRIHRSGAVGLALSGDVTVAPAVAQGCRPIGPVLRITSGEGTLLRELDSLPALEVVQRVLESLEPRDREHVRGSAVFLGFETDPFATDEGAWLVRNILGRERDGGGLFVGETVRRGRRVRLHVRDRVSSAEDLERTLAATADGPGAGCAGALLFSCLGRGMHLYGVPDHDSRAFHARFRDVPLGGCFCSGEIGPVGGATHLHGFTSSFGLFRPRGD